MKAPGRAAATLMSVVVAALIAGYSIIVPAFEAPDEPGHFRYVQLLAQGQGLPVQGREGDFDPEFSQPPLYYAIQALLARLIPAEGTRVPDWDRHNPYQNATAEGNVNLYSHPASESFPWSGQLLQLHAMRLLNLLFAGLTLAATYGIARGVGLSGGQSLAAAGLLGMLPQFDFIAGALNADNAVTAFAALALWLLLRWLKRPAGGMLLGVAAGAAMLSKLSGLAVAGLVLVVMLWHAWRKRQPALAFQAVVAGVVAATLGGWWYARNLVLYGNPLGWQPMLTAIGAMLRPRPLDPLQAAAALLHQWPSAIGVFGWNNLRLPDSVYIGVGVLLGLGLLGLVIRMSMPPLLLLLWPLAFGASLVRWAEVNADAAQWRLLFPAFPGLAVLVASGLYKLAGLAPVALTGLSAASLLLVVRPSYMPEPAYTGPIQHQLNARFGDAIELVGYDDPAPRNAPTGEPVSLTLYWRALRPLETDAIVHLAGLDVANEAGLQESTWPQQGRAPTSGWTPGQVVRDRHVLETASLPPGVWSLLVDVFEPREGAPRLPVSAGRTTVDVGRFLILPPQPRTAPSPEASFGESVNLLDHTESTEAGRLNVTLRWQATGAIPRDYTVFVHALDASGKLLAQNDSQPAGGRFPMSLLSPGVQIEDLHVLDRPPGANQLEIGVYDAQTGTRLKLAGKDEDALKLPLS